MTNWTQFWLTFVASSLDINGCVLNYFEGTVNLHYYTSCTLTTLHCSKVSFLQCCHMKRYNKILTKMWGVYSLLWDTVCMLPYVCTFFCTGSSCLQVRFLVRVNIPGMCNSDRVLKYSAMTAMIVSHENDDRMKKNLIGYSSNLDGTLSSDCLACNSMRF